MSISHKKSSNNLYPRDYRSYNLLTLKLYQYNVVYYQVKQKTSYKRMPYHLYTTTSSAYQTDIGHILNQSKY